MFLSQRNTPELACVHVEYEAEYLRISAPRMPSLQVRLVTEVGDGTLVDIQIHKDLCKGVDIGEIAADWFSEFLGKRCRLIGQVSEHPRIRMASALGYKISVSYADGYPILVTSLASLLDLNKRIKTDGGEGVPMDRFRPNIVVALSAPYAEESWKIIRIGKLELVGGGRCVRCSVTAVDQITGQVAQDPRPTLLTYNTNEDNKVTFGRYFGVKARSTGQIAVGDPVYVMD